MFCSQRQFDSPDKRCQHVGERAWVLPITLMRLIAIARSSGVRNQALVGESGKKILQNSRVGQGQISRDVCTYANATAVNRVRIPVIITSL